MNSSPNFTLGEGKERKDPTTTCPSITNIVFPPPGQPLSDPVVSTTLPTFGGGGLVPLQDTLLLETLAHFNRERIPER